MTGFGWEITSLRLLANRPVVTRAGLSERGALARFGCHGERGAQAYKGGLGRSPKRGSREHSPRWRVRGFAEPVLGTGRGRGRRLFDKSELQNDRAA